MSDTLRNTNRPLPLQRKGPQKRFSEYTQADFQARLDAERELKKGKYSEQMLNRYMENFEIGLRRRVADAVIEKSGGAREQLGRAIPTIAQTAFQNPWSNTAAPVPSSRERSDRELETRKEVERIENLSDSVNRLVIEQQDTTKLLNELRDAVKALEERSSQRNRPSTRAGSILGKAAEMVGGPAMRTILGGLVTGALGYALTDALINQFTGHESEENNSETPPSNALQELLNGTAPGAAAAAVDDVGSMGLQPQAAPATARQVPPGATPVILNDQVVGYMPEGGGPTITFDETGSQDLESVRNQLTRPAVESPRELQRQINSQTNLLPKSPVANQVNELPKSPVVNQVNELPKSPVVNQVNEPKSPVANQVNQVNELPKSPVANQVNQVNELPKSPVVNQVNELPKSPVANQVNELPKSPVVNQVNELPKSPVANQVNQVNEPKSPIVSETSDERKNETLSQLFGTDLSLKAKKITFKGDEIKFLGDVTPTSKGSVGNVVPFSGGVPGAVSRGAPPQAVPMGTGDAEGTAGGITPQSSEVSSTEVSDLKFAPGVDNRIKNEVAEKVKKVEGGSGKELTITSGFRDPVRNAAAGGARNSAHTRANAVDVRFRGNEQDTVKLIEKASEAGMGGIGVYGPGRVHLDTEAKRVWGPDFTARSIPEWAKPALQAHMTGQRQSESASGGGGAGEVDAAAVSTEAGAAVGAGPMETEGGNGSTTAETGNATAIGGEPTATLETAAVPQTGAALVGASTEAEVQDRVVPQQSEVASPMDQPTPGNPALTTSQYSHDPNDPGSVEPDDAAERYLRLFNMAA